MFSRIGEKAYKKDLDHIIFLSDKLGNPHRNFKSVHVAGTNGKGSTSHMLAAILQSAGYKTGLYTSPHLYDFRERIRINGEMISEGEVVDFVQRIFPLAIQPSFFEITVAMAFDHFSRHAVDIAIIETGLGGRLDSTNIIVPELSVITNIGWDHMDLLGNTLGAIASEKAGIIKNNIPVVIGETLPETFLVFRNQAERLGAPVSFADETYSISEVRQTDAGIHCVFHNRETDKDRDFITGSTGLYQVFNTRTVLTAIDVLRQSGFHTDDHAIRYGLLHFREITGLAGRWDILDRSPDIIADVAHNKDGIGKILHQLDTQYPKARLHFILGFVRDKDIESVLKLFSGDACYYFTNAHIPRALPHDELRQKAELFSLRGNSYDDVNDALAAAKRNAAPGDVIMICGSFFIISELTRH